MPDQTLAQRIKAKYPGQYDDLSDQDLETKIVAKYPGVYDDIPKTVKGPHPEARIGAAPEAAPRSWLKAGLDALPGIGAVAGAAIAGPETAGLAAIPAMALGAGVGRGLRDLIAEGFNIDQPSSAAAKGTRIALDTAETAAASAILPGLWEAIKTPGKTIGEVLDMLPAKLRPAIPPAMQRAPARILTRPAWQSWQPAVAPESAPPANATGTSMTPGPILQPRAPVSAPVETVPGETPPPAGPPPAPLPAAPAKSPQQLLNEEAIARRRAAMQGQSRPVAAPAVETPAPTANPKMSGEETKVYLDWRKQGIPDAQARERIIAARALNERFGLSTPTQAETEFPKGQRGKLTPKAPLTEAQQAASQPKTAEGFTNQPRIVSEVPVTGARYATKEGAERVEAARLQMKAAINADYPNPRARADAIASAREAVNQETTDAHVEAIRKLKGTAIQAVTETPVVSVGDMVKFKIPGPKGPMGVSGKIIKILEDGRAEIRLQQGGYHQIPVNELTPFSKP